MSRSARLTAVLASAAALAGIGLTAPASAEAVVYESRGVGSLPPGADPATTEWASLEVPTGYDPDRRNWHKVSFVEQHGAGRVITVDLDPWANTLKRFKAQRAAFAEKHADSYRELSFTVLDGQPFRARWTYTVEEAGTDDVDPFVTVYLKGGNRLKVVGSMADREHVTSIRRHVVRSLTFPG